VAESFFDEIGEDELRSGAAVAADGAVAAASSVRGLRRSGFTYHQLQISLNNT
jgi:hypothetical protein